MLNGRFKIISLIGIPVLALILAVMLTSVNGVIFAKDSDPATGKAKMHPENQSGVKGWIMFTDNGAGVDVTGTATGMDPAKTYRSLVYNDASVPGGPLGCEPRGGTTPSSMFIANWVVDGDGTGTLNGTNSNDLGTFKTVSIRDSNGGTKGDGRGPLAVVACGEVSVHKAK